MPNPKQSDTIITDREIEIARLKGLLKGAKQEAARHRDNAVLAVERFRALAALKGERRPFRRIRIPNSSAGLAGVAIAMWSDWHVAEVVKSAKVRGLNKYTPEIAAHRAQTCAESTRRIFRHLHKSYAIDTMVLILGGDFITGYLHPELAQTNAMGPIEEGIYAVQLLLRSLRIVLEEKGIKHLRIVAHRGNHGRTTQKMQFKNDFETSYETWLYTHLRDLLGEDDRLEFIIPESDIHLTEIVKGYNIRTFHGHQFKYGDGVGGMTIPLSKFLSKQDRTEQAQFSLFGHYHSQSLPTTHSFCCGSLKGFDEYSMSKGFSHEPPLQGFMLFDAERKMMAQHLPVFCE